MCFLLEQNRLFILIEYMNLFYSELLRAGKTFRRLRNLISVLSSISLNFDYIHIFCRQGEAWTMGCRMHCEPPGDKNGTSNSTACRSSQKTSLFHKVLRLHFIIQLHKQVSYMIYYYVYGKKWPLSLFITFLLHHLSNLKICAVIKTSLLSWQPLDSVFHLPPH